MGAKKLIAPGAYLVWEDLTVALPGYGGSHQEKKLLIQGFTGYAMPSRVIAIMGPSGSGKSTLLDCLAGRLANNVVTTGTILLNGKERRLDFGVVAYVTQETTLLGTLTVRETLNYSANLRLPSTMSKDDMALTVESTIEQMGLSDCANTPIGCWHLRGISGGERKRLSIALELLTRPQLLFLDEPTSGLDSASTLMIVMTLKQMAEDGKTVVASIHQPSSEVFSLLDDLCLLSSGEMVYFGESKRATQFFEYAGFPCPMRRNPSDHFLRCINSDFDSVLEKLRGSKRFRSIKMLNSVVQELENISVDPLENMETSYIKTTLIQRYQKSEYLAMAKEHIMEIKKIEYSMDGLDRGSEATWWKQLTTLTKRSFLNMSRDFGFYWLRAIVYIMTSFAIGSVFFNVGTSYRSIFARSSVSGFIFGFMTVMTIGWISSFILEMRVFASERLNGYYGVSVFVLSNTISSFPFLGVVALSSSVVIYQMVNLHQGLSHFLFFAVNLFGCLAVVETTTMIVASLVPNFLMGFGASAGVLGITMLGGGFVRTLPNLPKLFWRYPISYISYASWALQGQYKNDLLGLEFEPLTPSGSKLKGENIVEGLFGVSLDHSKWVDLSAIFAILICCKLIFITILKFKEATSPLLRYIHTKIATYKQPCQALKNESWPV